MYNYVFFTKIKVNLIYASLVMRYIMLPVSCKRIINGVVLMSYKNKKDLTMFIKYALGEKKNFLIMTHHDPEDYTLQ